MRFGIALGVLLFASPAWGLSAFPGAEGPGAAATGGRGGKVIKVTTLAADGPGSLQAALSASGPRIVVFGVSGVVHGHLKLGHGDVTIAGQTAPGGGITIEGQLVSDTAEGNIIVRHVRIRPPDRPSTIEGNQYDAMQLGKQSKLIVDHCSISWGVDETVDFYESNDVTLQWSTIEEAATNAGHPDGPNHNYGMIQGPDGKRIAVHHNLFAHNLNRNPAVANGPAEIRNNVVYNVRHGFVHHNPASGPFNIVGNYYKQGPDDTLIPFYFDDENASPAADLKYWLADNFIDDPDDNCVRVVEDPWSDKCHPSFEGMQAPASLRSATPFNFAPTNPGWVPVTTQPVKEAHDLVLGRSGAWPRDAVTKRVIGDVSARTGHFGLQGGDRPADLMTGLTPGEAPADGDNDGMPDAWETSKGLNPAVDDSKTVRPSGYTAIEEYINGLADELAGAPPHGTPPDGTTPNPDRPGGPNATPENPNDPAAAGGDSDSDSDSGRGCHVDPSSAGPEAFIALALALGLAWIARRRR
jgi:pectate lyase